MTCRPRGRPVLFVFFALLVAVGSRAEPAAHPPQAAIASAHPAATEAGFRILAQGGNAFDAAVAVSAALGVVEPYGSGLGGGGFWLLHRVADGRTVMLDGRERAPLAAHRDLYSDDRGQIRSDDSLNGPLAAAIPGVPAALAHLAARYGRLPLADSLAPAIRLARDGFEADPVYRAFAERRAATLGAAPAAATQFLVEGQVPPPNARIRQPDLAQTLEILAREGQAGFYAGPLAERLAEGVKAGGGLWTLQDLAEYRAVERAPIVGEYRGWRILSASPPSSGGVLLVEMLNMLKALEAESLGGAERIHTLAEVMRRAYRDRARYLGDPDRVAIPIERLTHPFYAAGLVRDFDPLGATPSLTPAAESAPTAPFPGAASPPLPGAGATAPEGRQTTHFSILDQEGNRVAATLSINTPFGCGFVPPGTGVLLNNEMNDFSAQPGIPNAYGLVGAEANAIAPGKRMLSSMSPTFLESERGIGILGTPGGSRIVTMVLQSILSATDGAPVQEWVSRPRIHHQFLPDRIEIEPGALRPEEQAALESKGHRVEVAGRPFGNMQAIFWDLQTGRVEAASDPRGIGAAEVRTIR